MKNNNIEQFPLMKSILGEETYLGFLTYQKEAFKRCWDIQQKYGEYYYLVGLTRRCFVLFGDAIAEVLEDSDRLQEEKSIVSSKEKKIKSDIRELILKLSGFPQDGNAALAYDYFTKKHYVTDTALRSMLGKLVERYEDTKSFPKLVVLDELLIHGRGLNNFLFHMEQGLAQGYRARLAQKDADDMVQDAASREIQSEFVKSLNIMVYAENQSERLLLKRYESRMTSTVLCSKPQWRSISLRFGQMVSVGLYSNVGFSWSIKYAKIPWRDDEIKNAGFFRAITTHVQSLEQKTYVWFYPSEESPVLASTIRFKRNAKKELICVPYIMSGVLRWENIYQIHEKLLRLTERQNKKAVTQFLTQNDRYATKANAYQYQRWYTETNDLILSCFLMKKFAREIGETADWKDYQKKFFDDTESIRYNQLLPNFRLHYEETEDDIADAALREIWEMDADLEELFHDLTQEAEPFSAGELLPERTDLRISANTDLQVDDTIAFAVEDVVAMLGIEAEKSAYFHYAANVIFSDQELINWGRNYSLGIVLQKFQEQLAIYEDSLIERPNLYQFIAILTQAMDLGLLGMSPSMDALKDQEPNQEIVYTRERAGEAALFILPIRYRYFLKNLDDIDQQYGKMNYLRDWEIEKLVDSLKEKDELAPDSWQVRPHRSGSVMKRQLEWFMELIHSSGQTFHEWNIKLNDTSENFKYSLEKI